jgi:MFS family permease
MLGTMASCGGMLEFILNPLIGRLSDKYGRFFFIMLGPVGNCVLDGLIAANPHSQALLVGGRVISGMTMTAFVTILRAAVSDVLEGSTLAAAHSQSALYSGVGIIAGPWLASRLGTDRAAFGLSSLAAGLNGLYLLNSFEETLPTGQRKEIDWSACNPLSFLKLFTTGDNNTLSLLCFAVWMQSVGEPRFTFDISMVIWKNVHNFGQKTMGNFAALIGAGYIVSGLLGKITIKKLGNMGHTTLANSINFCSNLIWSMDTGLNGSLVGNVMMMGGHRKRDGIEAMITKVGTVSLERAHCLSHCPSLLTLRVAFLQVGSDSGWGKGQISGMLANLKSVAFILAPQLYSGVYRATTTNGRKWHGSPMFVAALTALFSEVCIRMIKKEEIDAAMAKKAK